MQDFSTNQVFDGRKADFTAATAAQITTTSTPCKWLIVQALATNTKPLTIGASTVVHGGAAGTGRRGITLQPGEATDAMPYFRNLALIYVDTEVTNEGIQYFYGR